MTRKDLWLVLCAALPLISACQKAPELTISSSPTVELNVDGSSGSITFTANRAWTVSSSDSWVTVSPSSGEASDKPVTVTVRCNANTTYDDRTATVTIKMDELSQMVTVKQPANLGIVLPTQSYDLASDAKTLEITVQANVQYTVEIAGDWIRQNGTKGLSTDKLSFTVDENTTYDAREGKITIKSQNSSVADQVVSVKQAQKDALIVKDSSFDMPYGGGGIEVKVEANVDFEVQPSEEWIQYAETKALSNSTVYLTVAENQTYSSREGTVEITQKNGSLKHTVTVKQAGRVAVASVELNKSELMLEEGSSETLIATVYPENATDKIVSWSSSDSAIATVDDTGKVTAIMQGAATIIAESDGKDAKCTVVVSKDRSQEIIAFPDENFKAYCVATFDTDGDGNVSVAEARKVSSITINTDNITSLGGIEYFENLETLDCDGGISFDWNTWRFKSTGRLVSLDLGSNARLINFSCNNNQLASLDVSKNTLLESFSCSSNQLISLDLSNNTLLNDLNCSTNQLTSLDVSKNTLLKELRCSDNPLKVLDVNKNTLLDSLNCSLTQLTSLDVSKNTHLESLYCSSNQLISLDLSNNIFLRTLDCSTNQLTSLDVSKNTHLERLFCSSNQLISLDLSNNQLLKTLDCSTNQLASLDISKNTLLDNLYCSSNQLTVLDLSRNTLLVNLQCTFNQLTSLDVSKITFLKYLLCSSNPLQSLDLTNNTQLLELFCSDTQLTTLDISNNMQLYSVSCASNPNLYEIWLSPGQTIKYLNYDEVISEIRYKGVDEDYVVFSDDNFKSYCIGNFDHNHDGNLSIAEAKNIRTIDICTDEIVSLGGIEQFENLDTLRCYGTSADDIQANGKLAALDVSKNQKLTVLDCSYNQLTALDVSNNQNLSTLDCSYNQLTVLDVDQNIHLSWLICKGNQLRSLDVSNIGLFIYILDCTNNPDLSELWLSNGQTILFMFYDTNTTIKYR